MALTLGDNFSYQGAKPLDARLKYDTLAAMKAVADATMYDGCMAYCSATDKTYQWKSSNTIDETLGKWREFSSGGGGGSTYTAGDGIVIEDDEISIDPMPAEDMSEVISPLPSIQSRYHKYSTEEHIVGEWIDGKPIYQRTIAITDFSAVNTADRGWYALYTSPSNNYDRVFGVINEGTFLQYTDNGANWSICPNEYLSNSGSVPIYNALRANCNNGMLVISLLNCGATPYRSNITYTDRVLYVTVRYTKTA